MKIPKTNPWKAALSIYAKMSSSESYLHLENQRSRKHTHPAAERNKGPILECLKQHIEPSRNSMLLEISSGSGQHVSHFAPHFPKTTFHPTEIEESSLRSIAVHIDETPTKNIVPPKYLDVRDPPDKWLQGSLKPASFDYMLNINMMHISEWACSEGLFTGAGVLLKPGGLLFTYGPYAFDGKITPESNISFDAHLRHQNESWGLRDVVRELQPLAKSHGLILEQKYNLPANNNFLVWQKIKK